ncbi:MAG: hypothetical protein ACUVQK_16045 [Thermogutta sp.]
MAEQLQYVKSAKVWLKGHSQYDERWLRDLIADDPTILGLGDIVLKDKERTQPKAGRLDLLFEDPENNRRYEVELMLGRVDESHIIRIIEYWDIERKRYPQYEHYAVIVAEEITSRFLNVISLLNGSIPIIALQLNALAVEDRLVLCFTKVLDAITLGVDQESEGESAPADRAYWENRRFDVFLRIVDDIIRLINTQICQDIGPNYTKAYIGLTQGSRPNNFVTFQPRKKSCLIAIRLENADQYRAKLESEGPLEPFPGNSETVWLRFRLYDGQPKQFESLLLDLLKKSYEESTRVA